MLPPLAAVKVNTGTGSALALGAWVQCGAVGGAGGRFESGLSMLEVSFGAKWKVVDVCFDGVDT